MLSAVSIVGSCGLDRPEFEYRQEQESLLISETSRQALWPSQALLQTMLGTVPPEGEVAEA